LSANGNCFKRIYFAIQLNKQLPYPGACAGGVDLVITPPPPPQGFEKKKKKKKRKRKKKKRKVKYAL